MALTVTQSFDSFLSEIVNLDPKSTKTAKLSREWLLGQIQGFESTVQHFPRLYRDRHIYFGSFARRTKKRPLDDIDLMIALTAEGGTYTDYGTNIEVNVPPDNPLSRLCFDGSNVLNSKRVINKFVSALANVPQYSNADIKRNQEAAVLNLTSYDWSFDIVPCFFTTADWLGNQYYIIPDGQGHWKKTDPRKDRDRVTEINTAHNGNVLDTIRILKYWNRRSTMPSMPSYLLESMILDHYNTGAYCSEYVDINLGSAFQYIRDHIYTQVMDPKGIQGDINTVSLDEKGKIWDRCNSDLIKANTARAYESQGDMKKSISIWRDIFGPSFPIYG